MDSQETLVFAQRLMREVWEPLDAGAVPRFYHHDVIGHNRQQLPTFDDVVHRIVTDHSRYPNPVFDIQDIVAAQDKWAIRFIFTSTGSTGQGSTTEVIYFYHLRDGKISEFWVLADVAFDYKAET
jgi:predicted ester cyclase